MKYDLHEVPYDRERAVAYAHRWAYFRSPDYYDFEEIGGDCTNFASQCVFAGSGVMNHTLVTGWYYSGLGKRAPAWSGVTYLCNFLLSNGGAGPYGRQLSAAQMQAGDLVQLALTGDDFQHTAVVVAVNPALAPGEGIRVAAHSEDCDHRPLGSYAYREARFLHIDGVRKPQKSK